MDRHLGKLVEHRGTGTRGTVDEIEEWPHGGGIKCLWLLEADGTAFDVSASCFRRFYRPVRRSPRPRTGRV